MPQNVSVASFTPGEHLPIALKIPYLLSEDFDDKTDFEYKTEATTSNPDGISLSQYGFDEGWTGTRLQVSQKAMRISVRHETVAQYPGRSTLRRSPISKPGKTVNAESEPSMPTRTNRLSLLQFPETSRIRPLKKVTTASKTR